MIIQSNSQFIIYHLQFHITVLLNSKILRNVFLKKVLSSEKKACEI